MRADTPAEQAAIHAALQESGPAPMRARRSPAFPLFLAYALFVVYGTLLPFQFLTDAPALHAKLGWINWNPFVLVTGEPTPLTDVIMNIGFFLPLGFIAFHAQRKRPVRSAIVRATCAGVLLSATVEALQFFTPTRNPATSDVLTNGFGAALGAMAAAVFSTQLERRLRLRAQAWMLREPLLPVLVGCAVLVVVAALVPFDVAGSVNWIKRGVRLARLDPRGGPLDWADVVQSVVAYATLAGLATHVAGRLTRWSAPGRVARCWLGAAGLAIALEVAQVFVRSRVSSTRDVLSAMAGALLGCIVALLLGNGQRARMGWALAATGSLVGLTVQALAPFRFQLDVHAMVERLRFTALVPYSSYYYKATVAAVADFLEGLLAYVPLAFVLARQRRIDTSSRLRDALPVIIWCALFALALEVMQLGLPRRYPEVSDVLTAGLGAALGTAAWRWIAHLGSPAAAPSKTNGAAASQGRPRPSVPEPPGAGEPVDSTIAPASS